MAQRKAKIQFSTGFVTGAFVRVGHGCGFTRSLRIRLPVLVHHGKKVEKKVDKKVDKKVVKISLKYFANSSARARCFISKKQVFIFYVDFGQL